MQPYDRENGQYTEEDIAAIRKSDMTNLVLVYLYGFDNESVAFHFPKYEIQGKEYCELFDRYIRQFIKNDSSVIEEQKAIYFLTKLDKNDKSKFFTGIGYTYDNIAQFINDIRNGTDFTKSEFGKMTDKTFNIQTQTILNSYIVTSVWQIKEDGTVRLITLIPGGDKRWKSN